MPELCFEVEWEPGFGVTHPVLAHTWSRLAVRIDDQYITTLHDTRDKSTRTGTYGSVFPLSEWIVGNFWFLLWESPPPGAATAKWLRRHSLLAAREGASLPDLRLFRDEDKIIAEWRVTTARHLPVEFVSSGRVELDERSVQAALIRFVDSVLERLRGSTHPEVDALAADWEAVTTASGQDVELAARAARLGLDSFDETDVSEDIARVLTESLERLPKPTRDDLLDAGVAVKNIAHATGAIAELVAPPGSKAHITGGAKAAPFRVPAAAMPYQQGYAAARALRTHVHQPANGRVDINELLKRLGLGTEIHPWQADQNVKGIVGLSPHGTPILFAPNVMEEHQRRFTMARSLYALISGATARAPRVLPPVVRGYRLQVELLRPNCSLLQKCCGRTPAASRTMIGSRRSQMSSASPRPSSRNNSRTTKLDGMTRSSRRRRSP